MPTVLELRGVTRRFGNIFALDNVDFKVRSGKVTALVGENGAGKTTIVSIAAGALNPDSGELLINNENVRFSRPLDALSRGVGLVYQHTRLIDTLSCAENVGLGSAPSRFGVIDSVSLNSKVKSLFRRLRLERDPDELLSSLTLPERQKVEIARLLYREVKVLLLDEPTALLLPHETEDFFTVLREEAARGAAIVFVTHRLDDVFKVSEHITVLRGGRKIGERKTEETSKDEIAVMMVGEFKVGPGEKPALLDKTPIRVLENVSARRPGDRLLKLKDFTLDVFKGCIHGIAGVAGNGQDEIFDLLAGVLKPAGGHVLIKPDDIARVPGDRFREGGIPEFSLVENVELSYADIRSGFLLDRDAASRVVKKIISDLDVRHAVPETSYGSLSGGNAQRFLVGRELARPGTTITCLYNPTRGIDLKSRSELHSRIRSIASPVILISYDLEELLELSDIITVLYNGESRCTLKKSELTREYLASIMTGGRA